MLKHQFSKKIDLSDPAEPRLLESGVPVDALIAYYRAVDNDAVRVAHDFDLSQEEVQLAMDFYRHYPAVIDARLALNIS
jgi:uncharacterized protein (DUF433 family)